MSNVRTLKESVQRIASHSYLQAALLAAGIGLAIGLAGCSPGGSSRPASAQVLGTISHQGKPVAEGMVNFYSAETGNAGAGKIEAEGKYTISEGIPPGRYKVYVTPPPITAPPMPGEKAAPVKQYLDIPDAYRSDSTSNLSFEVKAGKNEGVDFKLD